VGNAADVGSRSGVSFGKIFDMGGNAWEWVADWYSATYYCDPLNDGGYALPTCNDTYTWEDPIGPDTGSEKVVKGGSWFHDMTLMRNASRERLAPENSSNIAGFRCAAGT
jgi:formylglycine-generating enzyme required for sulfatase activity